MYIPKVQRVKENVTKMEYVVGYKVSKRSPRRTCVVVTMNEGHEGGELQRSVEGRKINSCKPLADLGQPIAC